MAYVTDITCLVCKKTKHEVIDHSGICQDCRWKAKSKKERQFLSGLKGLAVEERLERIEKILYDLAENPKREIVY